MTCRVLKLARQPYYRWKNQPQTPAERLRQARTEALQRAHGEDPEFGYRLLADEARQAGFAMADRTAWRLCSLAGIMSVKESAVVSHPSLTHRALPRLR